MNLLGNLTFLACMLLAAVFALASPAPAGGERVLSDEHVERV